MTPPFDPHAVILRLRTAVEIEGTVTEVAAKCGLKLPTLESLMRGNSLPNSTTLACLCHGLDISADWVLFGKVRT